MYCSINFIRLINYNVSLFDIVEYIGKTIIFGISYSLMWPNLVTNVTLWMIRAFYHKNLWVLSSNTLISNWFCVTNSKSLRNMDDTNLILSLRLSFGVIIGLIFICVICSICRTYHDVQNCPDDIAAPLNQYQSDISRTRHQVAYPEIRINSETFSLMRIQPINHL